MLWQYPHCLLIHRRISAHIRPVTSRTRCCSRASSGVGRLVVREPGFVIHGTVSPNRKPRLCVEYSTLGAQARRDRSCVSHQGVCETQRTLCLTHETQTALRLTLGRK